MMQSDKPKLTQHLIMHHDGQAAGWLKFNDTPALLIEPNLWDQFKRDPSKGFKPMKLGRPSKKRDQKHEDKAKRVRSADEELGTDERPAPQDDANLGHLDLLSELRQAKRSETRLKKDVSDLKKNLDMREHFA